MMEAHKGQIKSLEEKIRVKNKEKEERESEIDKLERDIAQLRRERSEARENLIDMTAKYNAVLSK